MKSKPECLDLAKTSLFLDLDGTLAPIMPRPDDVVPDKRRTKLLKDLQLRLSNRLAVISGRDTSTIDYILEQSVMAVAGVHGLQRRTAFGERMDAVASEALDAVADAFAGMQKTHDGIFIEDKGLSVAVHYRHAPEAKGVIIEKAKNLAEKNGLGLQAGHEVIELRTLGPDKGDAIRAFMSEPPFMGYRPVFVGDDLTDEAGFVIARQAGGFGVKVGGGRSEADFTLSDPQAVLNWLEESLLCLT